MNLQMKFFVIWYACIPLLIYSKIHSAREYPMMGAAMWKHQFARSLWALYRLVVSSITFVRHLYVGGSGAALVRVYKIGMKRRKHNFKHKCLWVFSRCSSIKIKTLKFYFEHLTRLSYKFSISIHCKASIYHIRHGMTNLFSHKTCKTQTKFTQMFTVPHLLRRRNAQKQFSTYQSHKRLVRYSLTEVGIQSFKN